MLVLTAVCWSTAVAFTCRCRVAGRPAWSSASWAWVWPRWRPGRPAEVDLSRPDDLVRSGPYRYSRHPMYVGWAFVYAGTVLGARSTWGVLLAPALAALVDLEARAEERQLLTLFPDAYADYRSRVPRFLGVRRP